MRSDWKSVEEYISSFPVPTRGILEELRAEIRAVAPAASERISYQMPTFYQNGNLVHFAAFERHIGFYPGANAIRTFAGEITGYKSAKGSIQFPIGQPMPFDLIRRIVEFRVGENADKPKK